MLSHWNSEDRTRVLPGWAIAQALRAQQTPRDRTLDFWVWGLAACTLITLALIACGVWGY